jgi:hypothetical protein
MLLGAAGVGPDQQHLANILSNAIGVLAVLMVWVWVRIERKHAGVATLVALALLCFPYYFVLNLSAVSEPLGILLMAAAFAIVARQPGSARAILVAGLLIGIAPLARAALVPLPMAFVIWLIVSRRYALREVLLAASLACFPFLAWLAYRGMMGSDIYISYLTPERFGEARILWPEALWLQPLRVFDAFIGSMGGEYSAWTVGLGAGICAFAGFGCVLRLRQNRLDAWFYLGYMAMILLWPFPTELPRFLVAVYPCLLVCCVTAADRFARVTISGRVAPAAPLLAGLIVLATVPTINQFAIARCCRLTRSCWGTSESRDSFLRSRTPKHSEWLSFSVAHAFCFASPRRSFHRMDAFTLSPRRSRGCTAADSP